MTTKLFSHPDIFAHDRHAQHVAMKFNRIETIFTQLSELAGIEVVTAEAAPVSLLNLVHKQSYIDDLLQHAPTNDQETYALDQETIMNRYTLRALLLSVGAIKMAIDSVYNGEITNGFCLSYAGHHALPNYGMGFCFINGVAIGAKYAASFFRRIAVVDFDTHSGNGTIIALQDQANFLFVETYQAGFPGKVLPHEPNNIIRVTLELGKNARSSWRLAWQQRLLPALKQFQPELILISAGFDGHNNDPLGLSGLEDEDYTWLTSELVNIQPHIVSALEGGYSLADTSRCAKLHVQALAAL